ncbi:unnamed protein product [Rhodiola kirilowii]
MRWHAERNVNNEEYIRHPADGESWKTFDKDYLEFASEIRNVRLGLASDGFNPFGASGLSHSTWPIVLIPYYLPPHLCMKKEMNILCMLISGPKSPGKCLNVFMRPLIDELKELWEQGVCTYDRHDKSSFILKAAVMWTISDFPGGYAGSLKNKINLDDKKFIGLKTHDCHIMLQRLLPVFIRPYLPTNVIDPLISLLHWFRRLCYREFEKEEVHRLKVDIVHILYQLKCIFPLSFFTIMVHLMGHLPDQILLKGSVHYNSMYPMERQLGQYKKYVRNTRFLEGCIAEQYVAQECVMYCKLYMGKIGDTSHHEEVEEDYWDISVVSNVIKPMGYLRRMQFDNNAIDVMNWCVMENCEEAKEYINRHVDIFYMRNPNGDNDSRIDDFHSH